MIAGRRNDVGKHPKRLPLIFERNALRMPHGGPAHGSAGRRGGMSTLLLISSLRPSLLGTTRPPGTGGPLCGLGMKLGSKLVE